MHSLSPLKLTKIASLAIAVSASILGITLQCAQAQVLPEKLPPIPEIPAPKPPNSVPMGDPKDFPEMKTDFPMASGPFEPTWDSINKNHPGEVAWLRDSKFGIWVHFGPQASGQSGDWYARRMYEQGELGYKNHLRDFGHPSETGYIDVLHAWNPTKLDPAALVKLYEQAGAKFILVQAVHHDNFDNWNSKYQPWNSVNIGPHRDLLGEWSKAARDSKIHYGFAFHHEYTWWWYQHAFGSDATGDKAGVPYDAARLTLADGKGKWWEGYDPRLLYTIDLREYQGLLDHKYAPAGGIFTNHIEYAKWYATQWALRILDAVDKYDPDFIYTDGDSKQPFDAVKSSTGVKSDADQRVLASFFNRTLEKHGKMDTFSITKFHGPANGIVSTVESKIPKAIKIDQPWIGENAVGDWYYAPNFTYDAGSVVRYLLENVSRDGCYMVNIPIEPDGSLEDACKTMLTDIGDWMKTNGEGIYGSKAWKVAGEGADGKLHILPGGALGKKQAAVTFSPQDFRFTVGKSGDIYAYCMTVPPAGSALTVTSCGTDAKLLEKPVKSVSLLGYNKPIEWRQGPEGLRITYPADAVLKLSVAFKVTCE